MVETMSEVRASLEWLRRAQLDLQNAGVPHCQDVTVALLVQTPLALLWLEPLLAEAGGCFLDLDRIAEYLLACDRRNRRVQHLFQPLHPAALRLVRDAVGVVHGQGKRLDVCGDSAGAPGAVAVLLGLGVDGFCLPAEKIPATKEALRGLTVSAAQEFAEAALRMQSAAEVTALLEGFSESMRGSW
jgi:phosphoenolpyruvate-protein kinase (PTS system EI component)